MSSKTDLKALRNMIAEAQTILATAYSKRLPGLKKAATHL